MTSTDGLDDPNIRKAVLENNERRNDEDHDDDQVLPHINEVGRVLLPEFLQFLHAADALPKLGCGCGQLFGQPGTRIELILEYPRGEGLLVVEEVELAGRVHLFAVGDHG